jgi:hypothetical protein
MFFPPTAHCDGIYQTPDRSERSLMTLQLYLNDASTTPLGDLPLAGGATTFLSYFGATSNRESEVPARLDVMPKIGRVLLFQHRDLLHAGDEVVRGTKITLRTDLMYKLGRGDET